MVRRRLRIRVVSDEAHAVGEDLHVRIIILEVPPHPLYPERVKYSFVLIDRRIGRRVIAIDNCGGHGHHLHLGEDVIPYAFTDLRQAKDDFLEHVERYKRRWR